MERYVCIHGHFYQPTRINPWLEMVELQEDAYPYHDWNQRITAECYRPNCSSHLLNNRNKIRAISNNYSKISFNFGPTLLSWLKTENPETYRSIIDADLKSRDRFSGHGSAIAQNYNHIIMPLAADYNKKIQTIWAKKDFMINFGRVPEGIWLAETAVDTATLSTIAEIGFKFTILSPNQALRVRRINKNPGLQENTNPWTEVDGNRINTRMPYLCRLPSGRQITIFFYDNTLSNSVSFGNLLNDGRNFARSISQAPAAAQEIPEIICIASDGETYGHHHRFGDMALAFCLEELESMDELKLTVFGEYLEKYSPTHEVKIVENSSWSCIHGVARWKEDCGCTSGESGHRGWNQKWRTPLREAVDWLEAVVSDTFKNEIKEYIKPGEAEGILEDYIHVIDNRTQDSIKKYIDSRLIKKTPYNTIKVLKLLEMYRHSLLMQSSDGWFFDDISRTESIQILRHASRAMELAEDFGVTGLEESFRKYLKRAQSNKIKFANGDSIYTRYAKPSKHNHEKIAAYAAIDIHHGNRKGQKYCYIINNKMLDRMTGTGIAVTTGSISETSLLTLESADIIFAVVDLNDDITVYTSAVDRVNRLKVINKKIKKILNHRSVDITRNLIKINDYLSGLFNNCYHSDDLIKDFRLEAAYDVISSGLSEIESGVLDIYKKIRSAAGQPGQKHVSDTIYYEIFKAMSEFQNELLVLGRLRKSGRRMRKAELEQKLDMIATDRLNKMLYLYKQKPKDAVLLQNITEIFRILKSVPLNPDIREAQDIIFKIKEEIYDNIRTGEISIPGSWTKNFKKLLYLLKIEYENS
jgi:alpha-amylase/alpha-mannosidase (GH57 family)